MIRVESDLGQDRVVRGEDRTERESLHVGILLGGLDDLVKGRDIYWAE